MAKHDLSAFLAALPRSLAVDVSPEACAEAASDVFSAASHVPGAVLKPKSIGEVQKIWDSAAHHRVALVNRGGGLSYTSGVLPSGPGMAVLEMLGLKGISAPNTIDQSICVEAGVTWRALDEALIGSGWRAALTPPISGSASTVGGALAQGLPTGLEAVIGVDVVAPDGQLHAIGPHHMSPLQTGAHRTMGADLLGLFLGTGGIFGTIVRAHLRLERVPKATGYRSYAVTDLAAAAALLEAMGPQANGARLIAMPVRREADLAQLPFSDKIKTGLHALAAATGPRDVIKRLGLLAKTATLKPDMAAATASVHAIIEAYSFASVSETAGALDKIAQDHGARQLSAALPAVMQSRPYSLRGMLGPNGERWVPVHGIGALSQLRSYADVVNRFLAEQSRVLSANNITTSWLMMAWPGKCALIEPMFMWNAPLLPIHRAAGKVSETVDTTWTAEAEARTALVSTLKADLSKRLDQAGALHIQLGRAYAYQERLSPPIRALLSSIKETLDPEQLAAPGNLGFGS